MACGLGVQEVGYGKMAYTTRGRWFARVYMLIFCFSVIAFILVGQFKGNSNLVPSLKKVCGVP